MEVAAAEERSELRDARHQSVEQRRVVPEQLLGSELLSAAAQDALRNVANGRAAVGHERLPRASVGEVVDDDVGDGRLREPVV